MKSIQNSVITVSYFCDVSTPLVIVSSTCVFDHYDVNCITVFCHIVNWRVVRMYITPWDQHSSYQLYKMSKYSVVKTVMYKIFRNHIKQAIFDFLAYLLLKPLVASSKCKTGFDKESRASCHLHVIC